MSSAALGSLLFTGSCSQRQADEWDRLLQIVLVLAVLLVLVMSVAFVVGVVCLVRRRPSAWIGLANLAVALGALSDQLRASRPRLAVLVVMALFGFVGLRNLWLALRAHLGRPPRPPTHPPGGGPAGSSLTR